MGAQRLRPFLAGDGPDVDGDALGQMADLVDDPDAFPPGDVRRPWKAHRQLLDPTAAKEAFPLDLDYLGPGLAGAGGQVFKGRAGVC